MASSQYAVAPTTEPGRSPFLGRGWCYADTLMLLEARRAGTVAAITAGLSPPLRVFLQQTFFANSFYDMLPWTTLLNAAAFYLGIDESLLLQQIARHRADHDSSGINKLLLKLASPEKVVESIPKLAARYFDFVESTIDTRLPRYYELTTRGVPQAMSTTYMAVTQEFLVHTLRLANAGHPRHTWMAVEPDGTRDGYPLVRLHRRIEWSKK